MNLTHKAVTLLKVLLVFLFLMALVGQTLSWPGQFASMAAEEPKLAHLRWPLTAVAVLTLLCVQIVIVCTWKLLTMVKADRIFSTEALAWVDGIVWAVTGGWLIMLAGSAAVVLTIYFTPEFRDPGTPMLLAGVMLTGLVVVLLVVVLRALLRQAAALRTDMDAVI
jgi:hypothetical protein